MRYESFDFASPAVASNLELAATAAKLGTVDAALHAAREMAIQHAAYLRMMPVAPWIDEIRHTNDSHRQKRDLIGIVSEQVLQQPAYMTAAIDAVQALGREAVRDLAAARAFRRWSCDS